MGWRWKRTPAGWRRARPCGEALALAQKVPAQLAQGAQADPASAQMRLAQQAEAGLALAQWVVACAVWLLAPLLTQTAATGSWLAQWAVACVVWVLAPLLAQKAATGSGSAQWAVACVVCLLTLLESRGRQRRPCWPQRGRPCLRRRAGSA